jgi:PAS domain S-box-containing protein
LKKLPKEKGVDFRAMAKNSLDAVLVVSGENGEVVCCNPPAEKLSGFSADELLSHKFIEFLHPQEQIKLLQNYRQRLEGKPIPERYETKTVTKNGRIIQVEIKAQKISWDNRPADYITLKDISDLKWLESFIQSHSDVLDTLGECVTITDSAQTILYISNAFLKSTGFRKDDVVGRNNKDFFTGEMLTKLPEMEKRVLVEGGIWQGEITVRYPNDKNMKAWVHVNPLFSEKGNVIGTIAVIVNIKERTQLEEQLKTQTQILDTLGESFCTADLNGRLTFVSESTLKSGGWRKEDGVGHSIAEFISPEFPESILQIMNMIKEGKTWLGVVPARLPDGRVMNGTVHVSPLLDEEGKIIGAKAITVDIKERKQLEDQLKTQTQMLDSLMEGLATDAKGIITYVSERTCQLSGWRREDLLGRHVFESFPAEFHEKGREAFKLMLAGQSYSGEIPIICANGSIKRFRVHLKPVVKEGHVISIIGITADLKEKQPEVIPSLSTVAGDALNEGQPMLNTSEHLKQIQGRFDEVKEQLGKIGEALSGSISETNLSLKKIIEKSKTNPVQSQPEMPAAGKYHLEVYCLGALKVCSSDRQVQDWQSKRSKAVLEYLVSKPRIPVSKEVLMEALWPGNDPESAANNLRMAVHGLRQTLNTLLGLDTSIPTVLFSQGGYLLNPEFELVIDTEEFERYFAQGRNLEKESRTGLTMQAALRVYRQAEELYRGEYLEDELYEDWTLNRRETLKETYLLILNKLADYALNKSDYESCILYCQKTLARDACREDVYRRLMCCYSRLGQRNRAVQWYNTCRQTVKSELHTPLGPNTIDLYNRLIKGEEI